MINILRVNASNPALLEFIDFILKYRCGYGHLASETNVKWMLYAISDEFHQDFVSGRGQE